MIEGSEALSQTFEDLRKESKTWGCVFDVAGKEIEKNTLETRVLKDDFWSDPMQPGKS